MSVSSSQSRVTITLNLTGQAATVRGIQATETALKSLGDTAVAVSEKVGAASKDMSAAVDSANRQVMASSDAGSASMKAQADTAEASAARSATASEESAARVTTATRAASSGIMGLLTSFKALSVGAATYMGVKSYTSYSTALTQLSTLAGLTQSQVASLNAEILKTAPALRQSPTALAQAAYSPASERFGLAGSEQVMGYAAQLTNLSGNPIGGGAGSTSYAISTMLQTLGMAPTKANIAKVTAMIRGTTSAGDMQLTDLTGAMSTGMLNTGKTYGIDPEATLGALAYFTSQGVPAQEAATRMRMTESLLVGQTAQAAKYGKLLGLSVTGSDEAGLSSQLAGLGLSPTKMADLVRSGPGGLNQAFQLINQSLAALPQDQREAVWAKLFGGGRTDATAMQLAQGAMSGKLMDFTTAVIGSSTVGGLNQAIQQYNRSPQGQLKKFEAQLQTFATQFGTVVMPVLEQLMNILGPLLSLFAQHKILLDALAALVGGELAVKLLGLVKNLKLVQGALSVFRDMKAFDGIVSGASDAESAVGRLIAKLAAAKTAISGIGATETAGGAVEGAAGGVGLGLGLAAIPATVGAGGLAYGFYKLAQNDQNVDYGTGNRPIQLNAGNQAVQMLKGDNLSNLAALASLGRLDLSHLSSLSQISIPGYARGGVTTGPTAIVGEGNSRFPEYVVPTDPAYRARALGLFASLGGHLLAEGGTISASEVVLSKQLATNALPGLSTAERSLNTQIAMMVGAAQASTLTKLLATGATGPAAATASAVAAVIGGAAGKGSASPAANKALAQHLAASYGWTGNEWAALLALWTQESGFDNLARNPTSGAYGIAQALPASKYPLAGQAAGGSDPTAQIRWGLQYIKGRYGDPAGAEAHEKNFGWYAQGGVLPFASYDSGGLLPTGLSIAHNGTGAPEPVGHDLIPAVTGPAGDLHVHVDLDGRTVSNTVIRNFRQKAARL